jgi:hypothetical protein
MLWGSVRVSPEHSTEEGVGCERRLAQPCRHHCLFHVPDPHADALDLVKTKKEVGNQFVAPNGYRAEVSH